MVKGKQDTAKGKQDRPPRWPTAKGKQDTAKGKQDCLPRWPRAKGRGGVAGGQDCTPTERHIRLLLTEPGMAMSAGALVAFVTSVCRFRVSTVNGRPGVSILWLSEIASSIFHLSVAARKNRLGRSVPEIPFAWHSSGYPARRLALKGQTWHWLAQYQHCDCVR